MALKRIPGLDGVRGLAVILVVISHAGIGLFESGGRVGVTLFFVLSGYLITRLLVREHDQTGSIRLSAFYGRRALRLLPALFVYLAGFALITSSLRLALPLWDMTWPPALYLSNYVQLLGGDLYAHTHTWSLAVEEHFYLLWPMLILAGAIRRMRPFAVGVGLLLAWRLAIGVVDPSWGLVASDANAYALGFGCLLAVLERRGQLPTAPRFTGIMSLLLLAALSMVPTDGGSAVWLPPVAALLSAVAILGVLKSDPPYMRSHVLGWFGTISYALYLWHLPLMRLPGLSETAVLRLCAAAIAVTVAWCSWVLVERPIMNSRLRLRLTPGRTTDDGPAATTGGAKEELAVY
jgi:peptidoglycan/LPS O-acetylase OafA/YrhL